MKKEIEIKIKLEKKEKNSLSRILKKKFHGVFKPGFRQKTYQFFTDDFSSQKVFPRIRNERDKTFTLTIKVKNDRASHYFERKEYTIEISDIPEAAEMLKVLGFKNMVAWEKVRRDCRVAKLPVELSFDETPMGWFLEIEGDKKNIKRTLEIFGLDDKPKINRAYLGLWEDYKKERKIKKRDMLFDK